MNQNSYLKFINAADTLKRHHGQGTTPRNDKCCYSYQPMALLWVEGVYLLNNRSALLSGSRRVNSRKDERLREGQLVARAAVVAAGVWEETLEKGMEKGIEKRMEKARVEAVAVVGAAAQAAAA